MSSQAESDGQRRMFKRDVSYRSFRATTTKAFSTLRKKVSEIQGAASLRRRPLHEMNEDSPRAAKTPRRSNLAPPPPPVKRASAPSPSHLMRSPPGALQGIRAPWASPDGTPGSELSDFGDSPNIFDYKSPPARRLLPSALRRSVRQLAAKRGLLAPQLDDSPGAAKRLLHQRRSKAEAKRRISQLASPRRGLVYRGCGPSSLRSQASPAFPTGLPSPGRVAAEVNQLADGLASLAALANQIAPPNLSPVPK